MKQEETVDQISLDTLCALCGQRYGEHHNFMDWCPEGDWFSEVQSFQPEVKE